MLEQDHIYEITLFNGVKIKDLRVNGTCFIFKGTIDESAFKRNLTTVTYKDKTTGHTWTEENQKLALCQPYDQEPGHTLFALYTPSAQALAIEQLQAKVDYIDMMVM